MEKKIIEEITGKKPEENKEEKIKNSSKKQIKQI